MVIGYNTTGAFTIDADECPRCGGPRLDTVCTAPGCPRISFPCCGIGCDIATGRDGRCAHAVATHTKNDTSARIATERAACGLPPLIGGFNADF